jgi:hypothetical protein
MEMESLDGINLFFLVQPERPKEAPDVTIEKKVYDGELAMYSRIWLLIPTLLKMTVLVMTLIWIWKNKFIFKMLIRYK